MQLIGVHSRGFATIRATPQVAPAKQPLAGRGGDGMAKREAGYPITGDKMYGKCTLFFIIVTLQKHYFMLSCIIMQHIVIVKAHTYMFIFDKARNFDGSFELKLSLYSCRAFIQHE